MRKLVNIIGNVDNVSILLTFKRADVMAQNPAIMYERQQKIKKAFALLNKVASEKSCFSIKHLMVNGSDIQSLGIKEGVLIGQILRDCLEQVMRDNIDNEEFALLKYIKENYL
jgi:nicotinamide mononucleotide adenylyltransferase